LAVEAAALALLLPQAQQAQPTQVVGVVVLMAMVLQNQVAAV